MDSDWQYRVDKENFALLLAGDKSDIGLIKPEAAEQLRKRISILKGDSVVIYKIPVAALEEAGLRTDIWDKVAYRRLISKEGDVQHAFYKMRSTVKINGCEVKNNFLERLEGIAQRRKHEDAQVPRSLLTYDKKDIGR